MSKTKKPSKFKESKFYQEIKQLREEMKPMSFKERVDHIWTYYKEYIGLIALLLFITTGLITSMFRANKEVIITGIMVNVAVDQEGMNYLVEDYASSHGIKDADKVKLEYTTFHDLETNASEENYTAAMLVIAEVSAKKLDYMILDQLGMEFYSGQEVYLDLRDFFSTEELKILMEEKKLSFCIEEETLLEMTKELEGLPEEEKKQRTEEVLDKLRWECLENTEITGCWPAAVKITDLPYVKDNFIIVEGDVFFALSGSTEKLEEVRKVWNHIHGWKAKYQNDRVVRHGRFLCYKLLTNSSIVTSCPPSTRDFSAAKAI